MTTFTTSEVRATAHKWPNWRVGDMLNAYADRLEADEKEKPVADYDPRASFTVPIDTTTLQRNATHPAPADAERLAEALRRTCRKMKTFSRTGALDGAVAVWVDEIESVLAAHSAQAQPPAASVPDGLVDALRHQRHIDEDGAEVGVSRQAVCDKFMWQVRDTCARAEKDEAELAALKARISQSPIASVRTVNDSMGGITRTYVCHESQACIVLPSLEGKRVRLLVEE